MKIDKYKNKSKSRFIPDDEVHKDKREHRRNSPRASKNKIRNTLKHVDPKNLDDLDDMELD